MFESAEVGNALDKLTYKEESAKVRAALIDAQRELAAAPLSVIITVSGLEGSGKSEVVNLLLGLGAYAADLSQQPAPPAQTPPAAATAKPRPPSPEAPNQLPMVAQQQSQHIARN